METSDEELLVSNDELSVRNTIGFAPANEGANGNNDDSKRKLTITSSDLGQGTAA